MQKLQSALADSLPKARKRLFIISTALGLAVVACMFAIDFFGTGHTTGFVVFACLVRGLDGIRTS